VTVPWPVSVQVWLGPLIVVAGKPRGQFSVHGGQVVLDDEEVVAAVLEDLAGALGAGVGGVAGQQGSVQVEGAERGAQFGHLVRLAVHGGAGEDGAVVVPDHGDQVGVAVGARASQGLAVGGVGAQAGRGGRPRLRAGGPAARLALPGRVGR
jgi:hypothetical protein